MDAREILTEGMLDLVIAALAERANAATPEERARLRKLANSDELRERVKAIVTRHTREVE